MGFDLAEVDLQTLPYREAFSRSYIVKNAVGLDAMLNPKAADYALVQHLAYEQDKIERLLEDPSLLQTPIVRNGRQATVGYCPDVWKTWE